jgi:hypothetical protein
MQKEAENNNNNNNYNIEVTNEDYEQFFKNNLDGLKNKIIKQYKKSFYDLIEEKTCSDTPDYDWLVELYSEIREKIIYFLKKDSPLRKEIEESFDVELFSQMIKNNAFKANDLYNLINYTFEKFLQLGSPARDKDVKKMRDDLFSLMKDNATFGKIVSNYLKYTHMCLENFYDDMGKAPDILKSLLNKVKNQKK